MLQIKPSKNSLIYLSLAAFVLFMICSFTYINRASKIHALKAKIHDREQRLADSEKTVRQLSVVEQDYLDAQAMLGALEKGVSTRAYVPTFLRQLEELGKSVNMQVVSVRPRAQEQKPIVTESSGGQSSAPKKPEPYDKLDIDIEAKCKFWDAVNFLDKVTTFPKVIAVKDVQIIPIKIGEELGSPLLSVRISTTAFILKDSTAARKSTKTVESTLAASASGGG